MIPVEPNLELRVWLADRAGHLRARIDITPDHMQQGHWFEFELDQTDIPPILKSCDTILARFPVKRPSDRGL